MPSLSLRQAATETGTSKSTILRAIQSGRLSAGRTPDGGYAIEPSELFRVYEPRSSAPEAHRAASHGAPADETELRIRNAALEAQIEALRSMLDAANRRGDEVRGDMEHWRAQAERLALTVVSEPAPSRAPSILARVLRRIA